ncbi:sensor domain-containing diguanylate cyclase [Vibrio salinus]|uniref:sensor domain-containing diguanylate cyclase n=1 Tax=Vibrio salinus TaxID=2899784 RepID=UPI001E537811|nr:sensor domain-containing diguanylate cyclase [Vibrio salinus]MCE0496015.1 sensor domain-containing diguanylate cyclase [Vibrio salinus]
MPELLSAVNELSAWIILDNKFRIIRSSKEFRKLNGYDIKDISGLNPFPSIVFTNSYREKKSIISCLAEKNVWQGELSTIHKEGYIQTQLVKIQMVCSDNDDQRIFYMISFVDITEQKKVEHKLRALSEKDPLTGIWNRRKFDGELRHFCQLNGRYPDKSFGCLAIIDIDHFKLVNDELGHDIGDHVIQNIATTLKVFLRETDIIARVGGEEFAIILHQTSSEDASYILNRIRKSIHTNSDIPCSISCGITNITSSPENVYKRADVALYDAKSTGRNKIITLLTEEISEISTYESPQFSARA